MKKRGIGFSVGLCPVGLKGGGDPSQAQIRLKGDGTFDLLAGAVDIGQGSKTVLRQIAAHELDVPLESVTLSNIDTDSGPWSTGTFASRVTFVDGNAVIRAAKDLKEKMKVSAASMMEVEADQLEVADNKIFVKDKPENAMSMADLAGAVTWGGQFLVGTGAYVPGTIQLPDPETGKMTNVAAMSFGSTVAEVEVDTETGRVEVVKLVDAFEIGKVINPLLCKGQVHGGSTMGISFALAESAHPYYPAMDFAIDNIGDYVLTTAAEIPRETAHGFVEIPHPDGPYGAKGWSDGLPVDGTVTAIIAAIHDAIGVWITDLPATPERILRALESKELED
ncbi:MAG: molybdopterin cofactor-binding domain-containing protein [Pseudomonadota bacterium]